MMFMGTEWAQSGWWHVDEHRRLQWPLAEDTTGLRTLAFTRCPPSPPVAARERFIAKINDILFCL